jgi:PAS domain S-box-containing protein
MTDSQQQHPASLKLVDQSSSGLQAELDALQYENEKLKKINTVLMQRVEMGWGNYSSDYSSFQNAALLAEKVKNKEIKLRQAQHKLEVVNLDLNRIQQESKLGHQRLYDLIESVSDAIVLFDKDRRLILANSRFYDFWRNSGAPIKVGETRLQDLMAMSVASGVYNPAQDVSEKMVLRTNQISDCVFRLTDGRWLQMSERATSDNGLVLVYTDITQIKESEFARRERVQAEKNRTLQSMLDNLPQGASLVNANNKIESWNQRFLDLLGLQASSQIYGMDYLTLLKDTDVYDDALAFQQQETGTIPAQKIFEKEKRTASGKILHIHSHLILGGGYMNTYTDITERSHNAEALRESEYRLRLITDAMPALISYINSNLQYEFANKAFEEWLQRPSKDIEGLYLKQLLTETDYNNHSQYFEKALRGETVNFELEQKLSGGRQRNYYKTYIPHYGNGDVVLGFFALEQDVTERRRTAQGLKYAYQHMEQRVFERTKELNGLNKQLQSEIAERAVIEQNLLAATQVAEQANESKVKFMATAGHDLLQPLNAARLFSTALQQSELSQDTHRLVNSLNCSLNDVESIITTLVDISKLEAGVVEPIPSAFVVDELLVNLANEFQPQAKTAGLDFSYIPCHAVVDTDSQLLARILRNFLTNALRYTETGKLLMGCRRRVDGLEIQVFDTGIGIDEGQLPRIFEEFKRINPSNHADDKGLGLGLAIVEKLAAVLGCDVFVDSVPGKGSVFSVRVPYGKLTASNAPATVLSRLEQPLQGRRILVIDNEQAICEGMSLVLSSWGCEVETVQTLAEITTREEVLSPVPDLLIVDHQLNDDETGFDAVDIINQQLQQQLPVVMITANYSKELRQQVGSLGYRYLNKPVKPLKLRSMLTAILSL